MMHAWKSDENRSGGAPGGGEGRISRQRAARRAKIAVAAALLARSSNLSELRMYSHALPHSTALLVTRKYTSTPLIRIPISALTLGDTGQSFSARPIRSYISSSAAGDGCAP